MPGKPFSVNEMLAELDSLPLLRENASNALGDAREIFKEELAKCRVNKALFERIKKALEITTYDGFIFSFYTRVEGSSKSVVFKDPVKRQLALKRYLKKIEAIRPIFERLSSKARKRGLTARLGIYPLYLSFSNPFPTLVFSDAKGALFWTTVEPTGKSLTVKHIQGLKYTNALGRINLQKLTRFQTALAEMGYSRLRDGLFQELCNLGKGRFEKVHYLHPSNDPTFSIKPGIFYALARRQRMKRTKTRATKVLPKKRKI